MTHIRTDNVLHIELCPSAEKRLSDYATANNCGRAVACTIAIDRYLRLDRPQPTERTEPGTIKARTFRVPVDLLVKVDDLAVCHGVSIKAVVVSAILGCLP